MEDNPPDEAAVNVDGNAPMTPLERVEVELARLKALPDFVLPHGTGVAHLGPWEEMDEPTKDALLRNYIDWSGVSPDDWRRIREREVKKYDRSDCLRRHVREID